MHGLAPIIDVDIPPPGPGVGNLTPETGGKAEVEAADLGGGRIRSRRWGLPGCRRPRAHLAMTGRR
jgi:hypothetical protein